MNKTFAVLASLIAMPAVAQTVPPQSWSIAGDHTLDMPAQGAHSRSRPWLKTAAVPAKKASRIKPLR